MHFLVHAEAESSCDVSQLCRETSRTPTNNLGTLLLEEICMWGCGKMVLAAGAEALMGAETEGW